MKVCVIRFNVSSKDTGSGVLEGVHCNTLREFGHIEKLAEIEMTE